MITRYAHLNDVPGYAVRTDDRRVMFFTHTGTSRELTNTDIPALTLLGEVGRAEEQALLDKLAGGAAQVACTRKMER